MKRGYMVVVNPETEYTPAYRRGTLRERGWTRKRGLEAGAGDISIFDRRDPSDLAQIPEPTVGQYWQLHDLPVKKIIRIFLHPGEAEEEALFDDGHDVGVPLSNLRSSKAWRFVGPVTTMCASSYDYDPSSALGTATLRFDIDTEEHGVSGWWVAVGIVSGLALGAVVGGAMTVGAVQAMTPDERLKTFGPGGSTPPTSV